jgi:hypothetical protein
MNEGWSDKKLEYGSLSKEYIPDTHDDKEGN